MTELSQSALWSPLAADTSAPSSVYDHPAIRQQFVRSLDDELNEVVLVLEGVRCAGCVSSIEKRLGQLPGLRSVQINYATHRATLQWDEAYISLSQILAEIEKLGYHAWPDHPAQPHHHLDKERRFLLRRLGVAGVLGAQIMMFSVALYAGEASGMEAEFRRLFSWLCLILCLPVLGYAAQPFFQGAKQQLANRYAGMDVPVALALSLAFIGSVWTLSEDLLTGHSSGQIYFDSIAMFVFFLLAARFIELTTRLRGLQRADTLDKQLPQLATRLLPDGEEQVVAVDLRPGDQVLVKPGETIPADGKLLDATASIDESLLSGESRPCRKIAGDALAGGSVNLDNPLRMVVTEVGGNTVLARILRLMEQARNDKPRISQLAERVASVFILGVLLLAIGVAAYWWVYAPEQWLAITLSVLVVTCPCALSLATPSAMTAAGTTLARLGLLMTQGHALEGLARVTHVIFDKTGTLTTGRLQLTEVKLLGEFSETACLHHAAALEKWSEHPIGRALVQAATSLELPTVNNVENQAGGGLRGEIGGQRYYIGSPDFITAETDLEIPSLDDATHSIAILATSAQLLAVFLLRDELRPGACTLIGELQAEGKAVSLYSGDRPAAVEHIAKALGISDWAASMRPADKLARLTELQQQGAVVAMVGDGINDAPVLAKAQVSIAMGGGPDIARRQADMVLLEDKLTRLLDGFALADKTLNVVRQNIGWALGYNLLALPLAAMGWVAPWMAAIGMSCSSLLVVFNAMRLHRTNDTDEAEA